MRDFLCLLSMLLLVSLSSCVQRNDTGKLTEEKDSLAAVVAQKDSVIDGIFASINVIAENLDAIKRRENIIAADMAQGELPKQASAKINEDIQAIDRLLKENKQTIGRLEQSAQQLKKANVKIAGLEKMIAQLNSQIESKDQEIEVLRKNLDRANSQMAELNEKVTDLNTQVTGLNEEKATLEGEVKMQNDILNSGYYIVGPEKELLAKEIVYKSGFIGRTLKINENRSLESFTQIDIRNFDEVKIDPVKASHVQLVSSHPTGSFEFVTNDKGEVTALAIKDKGKFCQSPITRPGPFSGPPHRCPPRPGFAAGARHIYTKATAPFSGSRAERMGTAAECKAHDTLRRKKRRSDTYRPGICRPSPPAGSAEDDGVRI